MNSNKTVGQYLLNSRASSSTLDVSTPFLQASGDCGQGKGQGQWTNSGQVCIDVEGVGEGSGECSVKSRITKDYPVRTFLSNKSDSSNDDSGDTETDVDQKEGWGELFVGNKEVFLNSKLNILLILIPFAACAKYLGWGDGALFVLSLLALCPLAERLGYLTEQLALHTNETLGGLLNVTFGNAPELIVCIVALTKDSILIVQLTLIGSIISNLLMVLGSSLLVGGLKNGARAFKSRGLVMNFTVLILGLVFINVPTAVVSNLTDQLTKDGTQEASAKYVADINGQVLGLSRFYAIIMLLCYMLYILYEFLQHRSHSECADYLHGDEDDDEEEWEVGVLTSLIWLAIVGFLVSWLSDMMVGALVGTASQELNIPLPFMTIAFVPVVGNAAEHAGAIMFAYKNKVELSLSVAVGSPTQLLMFCLPVCVVVAWCMGVELSLSMPVLETTVVFAAVFVALVSLLDYKTNWAKGALMLLIYICIAAAYWANV